MIIKARFTQNLETINKFIEAYQNVNGPVKFFTDSIYSKQAFVVGECHEVMFFIGYLAGNGESGLESVTTL